MVEDKTCFKCGRTLPLKEGFYPHSQMKDGYLNKCKECTRKDAVTNRRGKEKYYRDYDKQRTRKPHRIAMRIAYQKASRMENPQKYLARQTAERALAKGELVQQSCYFCDSSMDIEMHHTDYSKPLQVYWLCLLCHRKLDNMLNTAGVK